MSEGITTFRAENTAHLDRRTHIERICPTHGESPAWLPNAARWHAGATQPELEPERAAIVGERRPYRLLEDAYVNDAIVPRGSDPDPKAYVA
jgi:hypothetical protein